MLHSLLGHPVILPTPPMWCRKEAVHSASSFSGYPLALCQAEDAAHVKGDGSLLWVQRIPQQSGPEGGDKRKRE